MIFPIRTRPAGFPTGRVSCFQDLIKELALEAVKKQRMVKIRVSDNKKTRPTLPLMSVAWRVRVANQLQKYRRQGKSFDEVIAENKNVTGALSPELTRYLRNRYNSGEKAERQRMGNWLTDGNVESELARFQTKFEDYIPYAEPVNNENGGQSMLVGYGTTRCYDENGNSRNLVKGEYMSEKEALEQRKRYLKYDAVPFVKAKTGLGLTNFDKYPPELKFHILDAVYNIGNNGLLKKSPKWKKELETYESSSGYSIKDYDVSKILVNGDWSINHRTRDGKHHSSLSVRSAMRRNPQKIDTNHYKDVLNANMWDSLYDYYVNQKY